MKKNFRFLNGIYKCITFFINYNLFNNFDIPAPFFICYQRFYKGVV